MPTRRPMDLATWQNCWRSCGGFIQACHLPVKNFIALLLSGHGGGRHPRMARATFGRGQRAGPARRHSNQKAIPRHIAMHVSTAQANLPPHATLSPHLLATAGGAISVMLKGHQPPARWCDCGTGYWTGDEVCRWFCFADSGPDGSMLQLKGVVHAECMPSHATSCLLADLMLCGLSEVRKHYF